MRIGHINLARSFNGTGEHFIALVEALHRQGIPQHVIVSNRAMARRVAIYDQVAVGPVCRSPVTAFCLMPDVDIVHIHNEKSAPSGLLLALTRSIPFLLTRRSQSPTMSKAIARAIHLRAAAIICTDRSIAAGVARLAPNSQISVIRDISRIDGDNAELLGNRTAAEHLRVYHRVADTHNMPALLL